MNQEQNQAQEVSNLKQQLARYEAMNSYQDDEIDLKELWNVIWAGKWKIILITFVFAVASVLYALSLPNIYKSEALLMPNSQEQKSGGLGALTGQLGGLASLAGISLGNSGASKTEYAIEVLKSRQFLFKFIRDNNLKAPLMASKGWNPETLDVLYDEEVFDINKGEWVGQSNDGDDLEPTILETYALFTEKLLKIDRNSETGMVTISFEHFSPILASTIVSSLIDTINISIKNDALEEAQQSITYLEKELYETKLSDMKSMFYKLIEQQHQTAMLTQVRADYVFKVIDKPIIPEEKSSPRRAVITLIGMILGMFISTFFIILRHYTKYK